MKTRIQKWGNSLALRIPKSFAAETHLEQGTLVEVSLHDGKNRILRFSKSGHEGLEAAYSTHYVWHRPPEKKWQVTED